MVGSQFNKQDFPEAAVIREGVDELTLRKGEEGMLSPFRQQHQVGRKQVGATAHGRRLTHNLSGHLQVRRGSGMRELEMNKELNARRPGGSSKAKFSSSEGAVLRRGGPAEGGSEEWSTDGRSRQRKQKKKSGTTHGHQRTP